jgi:hypothetical protein
MILRQGDDTVPVAAKKTPPQVGDGKKVNIVSGGDQVCSGPAGLTENKLKVSASPEAILIGRGTVIVNF